MLLPTVTLKTFSWFFWMYFGRQTQKIFSKITENIGVAENLLKNHRKLTQIVMRTLCKSIKHFDSLAHGLRFSRKWCHFVKMFPHPCFDLRGKFQCENCRSSNLEAHFNIVSGTYSYSVNFFSHRFMTSEFHGHNCSKNWLFVFDLP